MAAFFVCGLFLSCTKNPQEIIPQEEPVIPVLAFGNVTELSFPCEGGTASFSFTTNQDWTVTVDASWVKADLLRGNASENPVTVQVTVEANPDHEERSATLLVKAGTLSGEILLAQESAKEYQVTRTDFSTQRDGLKIGGVLYLPAGFKGKMPAIICCHGLSGSFSDTVPYGDAAARLGFAACCFDFCGGPRGMSLSEGEREDNTLLTEVADLAAVYDALASREDIDPEKIFVLGGSQGGLVAALFAAQHPSGIAGLGLLFPAFNIPDLVRLYVTLYGGPDNVPDSVSLSGHTFWRKYVLEAFDLYPYELIGKYEGPVLILHGDKDEMVPLSYSEDAVKTYKNASLIVLEGQYHGFNSTGVTLAIEYLGEFLSGLL